MSHETNQPTVEMRDINQLTDHPLANLIPKMRAEEWQPFLQDVMKRGVVEPLTILEDGRVLDGRHRLLAAKGAGLTILPVRVVQLNDRQATEFVLNAALLRRHLTDDQRAALALEWQQRESKKALSAAGRKGGRGRRKPSDNVDRGLSGRPRRKKRDIRAEAAKLFSVPEHKLRHAAALKKEAPELASRVGSGELTLHQAKKKATQQQREQERHARIEAANLKPGEDEGILEGEFQQIGEQIPDNSVQLIFVDPPYDKDSIPLYGALAKFAKRVLVPGGSLVCYAGHYALPEIFQLVTPHLKYWWAIALRLHGPHARMQNKHVLVGWKPLLWFTKGDYEGEYMDDFVEITAPPTKELHDWQQHEDEAHDCIEKLTQPGDLVVDPMCGSGTTCVAAAKLGRRNVGIEKEHETVMTARARLRAMVPQEGVV